MTLSFRVLKGDEIPCHLDSLARLRISVFRAWPYLYDGDLAYERRYMASYRDNPNAVLAVAMDGDQVVGASTGTPLADHADDFAKPFEGARLDINKVFYCAESVLSPEYRGQGAGHAFFDLREAHACQLGFTHAAFCGVIRPEDHPLRDSNVRPLDRFWRKRGYVPMDGVVARFRWKDIGETAETEKPLQFWSKPL